MRDDSDICGYETADGTPCQNPASEGNSCWLSEHGGDSDPSGRPSKLSYERQEKIATALEAGKSLNSAARMAGVTPQVVYNWLDRGEAEREQGNDNEYTEFLERFQEVWYDDYDHSEHCTKIKSREYSGKDSWNWKDNNRSYRGPNWHQQRKKALERASYRCENCSMTDKEHRKKHDYGLHVHHIIPRRMFADEDPKQNELTNLCVLCHACHEMYEGTQLSPVERGKA